MRRRSWCALLCALLLFQLAVPRVVAAAEVYFVGVEEKIQPLTDSTMPFWSKGYLYVSSDVFSGSRGQTLGLSSVYNASKHVLIVYSSKNRSALVFDVNTDYAQDPDGNKIYPGAVQKNGNVFVPIGVLARYFDMTYTVTDVPHGYLVWIRKPDFGLTEQQFADAATYNMESRYETYIKNKTPENSGTGTSVPGNSADGKKVFLCLKAGDDAAEQLDALDRQKANAAFFCTPDFLEQQGDLLRRMSATGQAIGILADAADPNETVEEQLRRGNENLYQAICGKTRMVSVLNDDGTAAAAAEKAGFRCLKADLDRTGYQLSSASHADALLQRVVAKRGSVTVWLGDRPAAAGLREFARAAEQAGCICSALKETT